MFMVDLYPLYPLSIRPTILTNVRTWYIETYKDRFFTDPPKWFTLFTVMEAIYHVPVSLTAIPLLWRGKGTLNSIISHCPSLD
ncbi:hypothetical protein OEA41_003288 [Lepraria neglecta]|uniref:EXPERA domain-containing protein n=1 Tax=Lepraria neglecta TaxID=209136 RepID=A0AAE0DIR7_9LECA|nr:hypothetical protein OEA41_003288 [Lepraria neglecta]